MPNTIRNGDDFETVIYELNSDLRKKYTDFAGTTFFGSRQRGDYREDSDFDIVILFSQKPGWEKENEVMGVVLEKELKYDIVIDAKVYHEMEIKKQDTPFRSVVYREGVNYGAYYDENLQRLFNNAPNIKFGKDIDIDALMNEVNDVVL